MAATYDGLSSMKRWLALAVYNLLLCLFTLIDFSKWVIALTKTKLSLQDTHQLKRDWQWGQKFGLQSFDLKAKHPEQKRYLLHCASMGEVISAMPLVNTLLLEQPNLTFVITTNTLTGKQQTLKLIEQLQLEEKVQHCYLPIDLPWLSKKLLRKSQADKLIIMEVELWPNLILTAQQLAIPSVVINGRMTDSSCRGYQKFSVLAQPMLQALTEINVRNQGDYDNYQQLGVAEEKLTLVGNVKFDIELPNTDDQVFWQQRFNLQEKRIIVAGSTHEGEESALIECYQQIETLVPNLVLIFAPRHPHRFQLVTELVAKSGLKYQTSSTGDTISADTQVIILDQMGVLNKVYSVADAVFVGGSIAKRGGHNPIEASAYAKPVIMGQYVYNNPEIINTLAEQGGLIKVVDKQQLQTQLQQLLQQPELAQRIGQKGLATIKTNSGAIARLVAKL